MTAIDFSTRLAGGSLYDVDRQESTAWTSTQPWKDLLTGRIQRILRERPDWELSTLHRALEFLETIQLPLPVPFLVDTAEGGTQLEWDVADIGIEVEFRPDGTTLVLGDDALRGDEWDGLLDEIHGQLTQLLKELAHRCRA